MALVTRYFSTAGAGDADGTSWANRAALLDGSGNWSTIITGFDFTSNALVCRIGPGTYTVGQSLIATIFTSTIPNTTNHIFFCGCDSAGDLYDTSRFKWVSAMPMWDYGFPLIDFTGSYLSQLENSVFYCVDITGSRNGYILTGAGGFIWSSVTNTGSGTSGYTASIANQKAAINSIFRCTNAYIYVLAQALPLINCRIEGSGVGVGSGNRNGIINTVPYDLIGCTICRVNGVGYKSEATSATRLFYINKTTIADCGSDGVYLSNSTTPTATTKIQNSVIVGCGGYGVNLSTMQVIASGNRLRNNTSGNFNGFTNYPTDLSNNVSAGNNNDEFMDYAGGDYRIRPTSYLWGNGYGAGDAPNLQRFLQRLRA